MRDINKMNSEERKTKLKDLQFELTKANVTANKAKAKTKEIKRAIARLLTVNNSSRTQNARPEEKSTGASESKPAAPKMQKENKARKGALSKKNQ